MPRWLLIVAGVACAAVVGFASGEAPTGPWLFSPSVLPPVDDPFPIRRVRATEAQLTELRKQFEAGPLVRLPRAEFEARVRAAGHVAADAKQLPRIAETRLKAALVGGDLVGTAELEIANPTATPRLFALEPLRLALGPASAIWADGREAIVGIPSGATAASVWLDRAGRHTLKVDWSAPGVAEPAERRFELRVPPAPTAVLVLELPVGQVPTVPAPEVLLTGPFPVAGNGGVAEWRIRFGGRSRLDIAVHPARNPGVPAASTLSARYDITTGQLACAFEYELRPAIGTISEWAFIIDPGLRVADVVMNNRSGWVVDPPVAPNAPRRLRVTLRQPGAGGKILISAVAPFPDATRPADAPLPGVRPVGVVLDDETLDIRVAPGLNIANWNAGDYRLTDSQTLSDQTRQLSLVGTLLAPGSDRPFRRLPMLTTQATEHEFTTTEQLAWRFEADRVSASLRVGVRVRKGTLFAFSLRMPPGYALARVASLPDELVSYSRSAANTAFVEFARPLTTGQMAELLFEFRGPALATGSHRLPVPAFTSLGASERVGVLGVLPGSVWKADLTLGVGTTRVGWLDAVVPQAPAGAAAAARYTGDNPDGWVHLTPARLSFAVETATRAEQRAGRGVSVQTFMIQVQAGTLPALLAVEPRNASPERSWQVTGGGNAVSAAVPLPFDEILQRFAGLVNTMPVRVWLVGFARPATGQLTLESTTPSDEANGEPAPRVTLAGATQYRVQSQPETKPLATRPTTKPWGFSGVYLVTAVRSPTDVMVVFGGTVTAARHSVLPITLPPGAEVRAAAVDGKWVVPGSLRVSADGTVNLPLPAQLPVRFEVRYRETIETTGPVTTVHSPEPKLPTEGEIQRWWAFSSGVLAGWPVRPWDRAAVTQLPPMLGDVPLLAAGVVVLRSPVDEMRVATTGTANAVGVGLAAMLLALGWAGGRRRHPFCGLLLVLGLFAVAIVGELGPPWWQRVAVVPLIAGLVVAGGMVVVRGHRTRVPAAAALAGFLALVIGSDTAAQQPVPTTVALLPPDKDGRETVVVPKSVLDRLAAIRPIVPGSIITSAEYTVVAADTTARVKAKFIVHTLPGAEPTAMLALPDARLERATVNGNGAFPTTPKPGVYAVPLPGAGRAEIELRFSVAVAGTGPEREIRFGVPEVPATRVTVELPGSAKQSQIVGRLGKQSVTPGARLRLEADTGAVKAIQARWRDGAAGTPNVKVREGCVWDVSEKGADLTAAYLVRVEQGTVSSLRFDVPAELEPLSISLRSQEPGATAALRDWTIAPEQAGFRSLRLELQEPTAGRLLVVLMLSPRKPLTQAPVLRFPRVAIPGVPAAEPDAAYGLRTKNAVSEKLERSGMIDFAPDALTREFANVVELRLDQNIPVRVFRPTVRSGAELRPTLRPNGEPPSFTLDTTWNLGTHRAMATGTIRWLGKEPQALVEFSLPAVKVLELRGADVSSWSMHDGRVQVWLRRGVKEGEVNWTGTVTAPPTPFEIGTPRQISGHLSMDVVKIHPAEGFSLVVERDRGWTHAPTSTGQLSYRTSNPAFPSVRVAVSPINRPLQPEELGWLGPKPRPKQPVEPTVVPRETPTVAAQRPTGSPSALPDVMQPWMWPVSAAVGWGASVLLLAMLLRFPRSTWPEQLGLVGGLLGYATGHGWWVGPGLWVAGRTVWVLEALARNARRM